MSGPRQVVGHSDYSVFETESAGSSNMVDWSSLVINTRRSSFPSKPQAPTDQQRWQHASRQRRVVWEVCNAGQLGCMAAATESLAEMAADDAAGLRAGTMCSICHEKLEPRAASNTVTPCGHMLHESCLSSWATYSGAGTCPICRSSL